MSVLLGLGCNGGEISDSPSGDPGRVTLHRLNRAEYDATVRDLLLTDLRPAQDFPADDFGDGFDNIADVLSISPLHVEMYEAAADTLIDGALRVGLLEPQLDHIEAESPEVVTSVGGPSGEGWNLWSNGTLDAEVTLPQAGRYRVRVRAYGQQAGPDFAMMSIRVDGFAEEIFEVMAESNAPEIYTVETQLSAGVHTIGAAFLNDYYDENLGEDRNLVVDWVRSEGPLDVSLEPPRGRARVFTCDPQSAGEEACAREILSGFARQAWRRPLTDAEVTQLLDLYTLSRNSGGDWEEGVLLAIKAVLVSPHFIYRVEIDPDPGSATPTPLDPWELASRLSYFLWSSMPDDQLFALAEDGTLTDPDVLEAEVRRMLGDPRASALVDNLAGQWFYIRAVDSAFPDYAVFPDWDEDLRAAMKEEMHRMVSDIMLDDRSMLEILTTQSTWVNPRLAAHYGIDPPEGDDWKEVSLAGTSRSGILTTGGLLTALSYSRRTSPVRRGKWVLESLTCEEPPPPPPGVEGLPDEPSEDLSLREQMEQHRADPLCASCHSLMDPIGFGLEHFDGIGAYRDFDRVGFPIDATGVLPGNVAFDGAVELAQTLAADAKVPWCMVQKTFTYALGRPPTVDDIYHLKDIEARFAAGDHHFAELAVAIVLSQPFRYRRGETDDDKRRGGLR